MGKEGEEDLEPYGWIISKNGKSSYVDGVRKADNRESWKSMIANLLGADDTQ